MIMKEEYVYHVDENDAVLGRITRREMRAKNLMHRVADILVFNTKGEILVHKRTKNKDLFPGYYALLIGGSVSFGENYDECARRELKEEIGARNPKLIFLFKHKYDTQYNRIFAHVYKTVYDSPLHLQKEEIESGEFMPLGKLQIFIKQVQFCPDDLEIFNKYLKEFHGKKQK